MAQKKLISTLAIVLITNAIKKSSRVVAEFLKSMMRKERAVNPRMIDLASWN